MTQNSARSGNGQELEGRHVAGSLTLVGLTERGRYLGDDLERVRTSGSEPERASWLRRWREFLADSKRVHARIFELLDTEDALEAAVAGDWPIVPEAG